MKEKLIEEINKRYNLKIEIVEKLSNIYIIKFKIEEKEISFIFMVNSLITFENNLKELQRKLNEQIINYYLLK